VTTNVETYHGWCAPAHCDVGVPAVVRRDLLAFRTPADLHEKRSLP